MRACNTSVFYVFAKLTGHVWTEHVSLGHVRAIQVIDYRFFLRNTF